MKEAQSSMLNASRRKNFIGYGAMSDCYFSLERLATGAFSIPVQTAGPGFRPALPHNEKQSASKPAPSLRWLTRTVFRCGAADTRPPVTHT
jgi:hypothetical protein